MGLARTTSILSEYIIRTLGDCGGTVRRDVESELNNIIAWAKDSPRRIKTDISIVGNVGTGLDLLHTFSLDTPNRLLTNEDWLRIRYSGEFATNDNDKRIKISFGSATVVDSGLFDQDSGDWTYDIIYARVSSTTVRVSLTQMWGAFTRDGAGTMAGNGVFGTTNTLLTGLSDLSANATTLKVEAEGTANDDITQNLSVIELVQQ